MKSKGRIDSKTVLIRENKRQLRRTMKKGNWAILLLTQPNFKKMTRSIILSTNWKYPKSQSSSAKVNTRVRFAKIMLRRDHVLIDQDASLLMGFESWVDQSQCLRMKISGKGFARTFGPTQFVVTEYDVVFSTTKTLIRIATFWRLWVLFFMRIRVLFKRAHVF